MGDQRGLSPNIALKQFWHLKNALKQDLTVRSNNDLR